MRPILDVANHHKCKYLEKFPEKYMTWQAIWSCGRRPDIFIAKGTMTADVYLKECLQKIILPLIWEHRAPEIFWTDLTTAHYARKVLEGPKYCSKTLKPTKLSRDSPNRTILGHYQAEVVGGYEVYQNSIRVEEKVASCLCWNDRRSV